MEITVKLDMEAMDRVDVFGKRPELILTPKATSLFATVSTKLTALRDYGAEQIAGKQGYHDGVSNRRQLAKEIRTTLIEMAGLAKSMEEEGEVGMTDLFPYPKYMGYEPLLLTAESFADRATPIIAQFTDRGMPATFVVDLRANITAFRAATEDKYSGKADRTFGTAGLFATAKAGMKAVRALRPIMRVLLRDNEALLAAWTLASRVERPPSSTPQPPATPPPPAGDPPSGS